MGNTELTQTTYWNQEWSRLRPEAWYAHLAWVRKNYQYAALDRLFRSVLPVDPSKTCIELGSGPGRWPIYFHKIFRYRVFGCDYSEVSCELARQNLALAGVAGTIFQRNFFDLQGQYDVVFSAGVVEHFDDPKLPLASFARLVRPGGTLITDVPNLSGLNGFYRRVLKPETFRTHRVVTLAELRQWHTEIGLEELRATCYGSICLSRVPPDAFKRLPWIQRFVWTPINTVASAVINRACHLLSRVGLVIDHPLISPHLIVISRKPYGEPR